MNIGFIKGILQFALLLLVQVLVLNNIHLMDRATPLLYIYMVVLFAHDYPRWAILLLCFLMGLLADMFTNTPGVGAASMTLLGLLQPYVLKIFLTRDSADDLRPSLRSLGAVKYVCYVSILSVVYCVVYFALESFSFFNWRLWLECALSSAALTIVLILVLEAMRKR